MISVVIEGYNEEYTRLAYHVETIDALLRQDFPLHQVEVVLLGSAQQIKDWNELRPGWRAFWDVRMVPVDPVANHYWQLKNKGAEIAAGEFVGFIDSDVCPGPRWLAAIVNGLQNGADAVVGPSLYRTEHIGSASPLMLAAALPSWGFVLSRRSSRQTPKAASLLAHNLGMRRSFFLQHPFPTLQRSFCSSLLYNQLVRSGAKIAFQPEQKVSHGLMFRWWIGRRHFRTGWETYNARKMDPDWPRIPALEKLKFLEPFVLRMGLVCRDARHWFRFSRVLGIGRLKAILLFPLALFASVTARVAEMAGMYGALLAPESTEHRARF